MTETPKRRWGKLCGLNFLGQKILFDEDRVILLFYIIGQLPYSFTNNLSTIVIDLEVSIGRDYWCLSHCHVETMESFNSYFSHIDWIDVCHFHSDSMLVCLSNTLFQLLNQASRIIKQYGSSFTMTPWAFHQEVPSWMMV